MIVQGGVGIDLMRTLCTEMRPLEAGFLREWFMPPRGGSRGFDYRQPGLRHGVFHPLAPPLAIIVPPRWGCFR